VEVRIEHVPRYERLAAAFRRQADNGASVSTLANTYGMSWKEAKQILTFARTGERPR
jgi:hypothetical protein